MRRVNVDDYCNNDHEDKVEKFLEVDKVCIGCPKPCITTILKGSVKVEVKDTKIVKNCDGFKLIVIGCKYIKIHYCSNDCCACNKIFTDTFVVPFKHSFDFCGCYRDLRDIDVDVYRCTIKKISDRCAVVKSVICVEPDFEEPEYDDWDDDWDCNCKVDSDCCKRC